MEFIAFMLFYFFISTTRADDKLLSKDLKLEIVQVLFRHGARTPVQPDFISCKIANTSAFEPYGFGELTKEGKEQEYKFGLFLRYRYTDFLSLTYKPEDVYAYASDVSRTKMSLESLLAGLYPPVGPAVWNPHLKWSSIPYLLTPKNLDCFLGSYKNPKFLRLLLQIFESHEFGKKVDDYSDFLAFVKEKALILNCSSPLMASAFTYDLFTAKEHMNLPLPDWYTPEIKKRLIGIAEIAFDTFTGTTEMKKFAIGSVIKTFISNMNLNGKNEKTKKIFLYAAHDANVALFARAHRVQELRVPPFGSAVILEKLRDFHNRTFVRLLAWDGVGELKTLKLGNHEEFCPIEDYVKIVEKMLPSEKEVNEMLDEILGEEKVKEIKRLIYKIFKTLWR